MMHGRGSYFGQSRLIVTARSRCKVPLKTAVGWSFLFIMTNVVCSGTFGAELCYRTSA